MSGTAQWSGTAGRHGRCARASSRALCVSVFACAMRPPWIARQPRGGCLCLPPTSTHAAEPPLPLPPLTLNLRYVYKPELKGKDGTNKPALALEVLRKGAHDAGLENPQECGAQWNTGVMYWRATPRAIRLLDFSKEVMAADTTYPENPMKRDDQKPINAALRVASEACAWSAQDKVPEVRTGLASRDGHFSAGVRLR